VTVLGSLTRSLEDPSQPLTSSSLATWLGGGSRSLAGVSVSESRVFGLTAYYRGVVIVAGTAAGLPIKVFRRGSREEVRARTVLDSPNPRQTPFEFWFTTFAHAVSWGNAFSRKLRDGSGIVRQVWPIHPSRVRVEEVDPSPANPAGKVFIVRDAKGGETRYTPDEIFHIPYLSLDGLAGIRPLEVMRQSLGIGIAVENEAARFYGNGTRISGILRTEQKLEKGQADTLKARWREKVAGPENAGEIAVLDNGANFQPITLPPGDAQLLESRSFAVDEIARMLGLPPHMLGNVSTSTSWGSGIEQQTLGFVRFSFKHWFDLVEQRVTRELLPGGWDSGSWFAEYDLEGLLRGDSAARAAFYHAGITDGWLNRNEVRVKENREPVDGLDEFIVPSNMTLVSVNGELVPLSAGGSKEPTEPDPTA
jgi:HK97 family phage portal protein